MISKHLTLTSLFLCLTGTAVAWCNNGGVPWSDIGPNTTIMEGFHIICETMQPPYPACVDIGNNHINATIVLDMVPRDDSPFTESVCYGLLNQAKASCAGYGGSIEGASDDPYFAGWITANPKKGPCSEDHDEF